MSNGCCYVIRIILRMIDDLPAAVMVTSKDDEMEYWFEDTHPLGFMDDGKAVVYNHVGMSSVVHSSWPSLSRTTRTVTASTVSSASA